MTIELQALGAPPDEVTRAHRELDLACLKAMVPLLKGLPLRTYGSLVRDGDGAADPKELRRLVDFFNLLLQRISVTEVKHVPSFQVLAI
jgi:hypothetical protein